MILLKDLLIGIGVYLAVVVAWYLVLAIPELFSHRQSGFHSLAAFTIPCFVVGVLFIGTSVLLYRLGTS